MQWPMFPPKRNIGGAALQLGHPVDANILTFGERSWDRPTCGHDYLMCDIIDVNFVQSGAVLHIFP